MYFTKKKELYAAELMNVQNDSSGFRMGIFYQSFCLEDKPHKKVTRDEYLQLRSIGVLCIPLASTKQVIPCLYTAISSDWKVQNNEKKFRTPKLPFNIYKYGT